MSNLMRYLTPTVAIPIVVLALIICFFVYYWRSMAPRKGTLEWVELASRPEPRFTFALKRRPMTKKDALPLCLLTLVYAATAFFQLGSFTNPQTFCQLSSGESATIAFKEEVSVSGLMYYTGLNVGYSTIEVSSDGEHWRSLWFREEDKAAGNEAFYYWADGTDCPASQNLSQKYSEMFKWLEITPRESVQVKFLRLTGHPEPGDDWVELGELALYDEQGARIGAEQIAYAEDQAARLFDEQDVVPDHPSWYNSSYFDEVYHPRTALEHIRNLYPYEVTHPPLGKLIMALGIQLFGMTPFGWRFMGTLFGVLMLPLLYVFLKNLFGKTVVATCGTALFAFDFMHLTQTRIATIDTYGVFFILAMYFFMYRYLTQPAGTSFAGGALPLFLSGLMWGLGAASKWTVFYGGLGLAILYFIGLYFRWRDWPREEGAPRFGPWCAKTILFSVLCFILIPAVIYTASYIPYATALGVDLSPGNTLAGIGRSLPVLLQNLWGHLTGGADFQAAQIPTDSLTGIMANNQWYMLTYHEGVMQSHGYSSRWYQWIVDARPILYYLDNSQVSQGLKTAFGAFNNPIVSWAGLLAVLTCASQAFRRAASKIAFFLLTAAGAAAALVTVDGILSPTLEASVRTQNLVLMLLGLALYLAFGAFTVYAFPRRSGKALFIVVGYLSQLVPWLLIGRTTFAYHYFPSVIFLVLAICYVFNDLIERNARYWRGAVYGLTGGAVVCFAAFYPVLIGLTVPTWYTTNLLCWIPSAWPF